MTFRPARPGLALHSAAILALLSPAALSAQRQNGLVVGRVLSGDVAVPGATIYVSGGRVTLARVDGRFRLSLPAGRYQVRAQRIGYASGTDSVTIVAGDSAVANFRIERAASSLEQVASVGTRGFERSVINGMAPIDIIDGVRLRATGRSETSRALAAVAPSVALSYGTVGDASDLVRPVTLRGLGADEVLVLVNGKRRHASALLNTTRNGGRGSSGVDLDAIPVSLIDHVEILHGNAVAQYGSDAIGGVINVVLKSGVHGFAASTVGSASTNVNAGSDGGTYPVGAMRATDGRTATASIDKGVVFGQRGFLHGGFEMRDRGATNRALADPTMATPAVVSPYGDPRTHDAALFLNGGNLLGNGLEVYGTVGGSRRTVDAATQYDMSATPALLPVIRGTMDDYAGTLGLRGHGDDWRWDLSSGYGANKVAESVSPAISTLGFGTQAQADAGAQRLSQWTTSLDLTREYSLFDELRFAAGAEIRRDAYRVDAAPVGAASTMYSGLIGFTPAQAQDRSRREYGGYVDIETDVNSAVTVGLAGRTERYSTVGPQYAGKLSLRAEPVRNYVFRASVARGFRVPTMPQDVLSRTYVDVMGPVDLVTPLSANAVAQGGEALKAEHSLDYQAGVAVVVSPALSFTLDGYRSDVSDRVALSDVFFVAGGSVPYHFLRNSLDTRTDGLDATVSYVTAVGGAASLRLTGGANVNHTTVRRVSTVTPASVTFPNVSDVALTRMTQGTPRDNLLGSALFTLHDFSAMLRTQRFGEVSGNGTSQFVTPTQAYGPRWVTDLNASYTLLRKYTFTAGADNLFDTYPQRMRFDPSAPTLRGITPYDASSPFGFNGRFVYGRLSIYL